MLIVTRLDRLMTTRKISSRGLAARFGTSTVSLSNIKNRYIRGMRFSRLEALCRVLMCKLCDVIDNATPEQAYFMKVCVIKSSKCNSECSIVGGLYECE